MHIKLFVLIKCSFQAVLHCAALRSIMRGKVNRTVKETLTTRPHVCMQKHEPGFVRENFFKINLPGKLGIVF